MNDDKKWNDLRVRVLSALVLVGIGVVDIWLGGPWFAALAILAGGLMIWELAMMHEPGRRSEAWALGAIAAVCLIAALNLQAPIAYLPLLMPCAVPFVLPRRGTKVFAAYGTGVLFACFALVAFRQDYGLTWLFWLISVVIASDVGGYFGGRTFGGRKFWPSVSPKKTWSGTISGWVGAALVGAGFAVFSGASFWLIIVSPLIAFAAQLGDIAESGIKRRCGVKDSSRLIPGHGGLMDRFDGLIGATLAVFLWSLFGALPVIGS